MSVDKKFRLKYYVNYMIIGAALLLFLVLDVTGILNRSTQQMIAQIGYSIVLAVSLNLVVGFLGELSLGHAGFMCVGAYVGCLFSNWFYTIVDIKWLVVPLAMICGGLAAAIFGFLIGLPTLRLKGDYLAIVTLAFGEIIRTICLNQDFLGGALGLKNGHAFGTDIYVVALISALIVVAVAQNLRRSKHGRAIQAIRDNEIAARAMGVNVTYYKLVVFIIAAFFAGLAGVIYGQMNSPILSTKFDYNYSIDILVMVVLGGMGNIMGSIVASSLLVFVNFTLQNSLSGSAVVYKYLIYALILIFAIFWNNAPFMRPLRNRVQNFFASLRHRIFVRKHEEGGTDAPETAAWDKVPTKIPMDTILSTDFTVDRTFEADAPDKKGGK